MDPLNDHIAGKEQQFPAGPLENRSVISDATLHMGTVGRSAQSPPEPVDERDFSKRMDGLHPHPEGMRWRKVMANASRTLLWKMWTVMDAAKVPVRS